MAQSTLKPWSLKHSCRRKPNLLYVNGGAVVVDMEAELSEVDDVVISVVLDTLIAAMPRAGAIVAIGMASKIVMCDAA